MFDLPGTPSFSAEASPGRTRAVVLDASVLLVHAMQPALPAFFLAGLDDGLVVGFIGAHPPAFRTVCRSPSATAPSTTPSARTARYAAVRPSDGPAWP